MLTQCSLRWRDVLATFDVLPQAYSAVLLLCVLQNAVVLDPYAKAVIGRRRFGDLGPVSCCFPTTTLCGPAERLLLAGTLQNRPQPQYFLNMASGHRPWCCGSSWGVTHLAAVCSCGASGRRLRLAGRPAPAPATGTIQTFAVMSLLVAVSKALRDYLEADIVYSADPMVCRRTS